MKYLSNLTDLEFAGKAYDQGAEIKATEENQGALDILVKRGDVTEIGDDDPKVTSNGPSAEAPHPLDHDRDGRKGGSEAGDKATARKK
jgi:hypothetical protein